jgi:ATP-dependent exoDNAse (exonuclease V) beta subunit
VKVWPGSVEISAVRERAFALSRHEQLLTGSMDRLVIVRSDGKAIGADVVDFKTDEVDAGDHKMIVERVDFYRPQMESYRSAAADLLHINVEKVTARLVFLSAGVVQAV